VVGVPDAKYGEELCAWIAIRPGIEIDEEEIRSFCRGRTAHYKIPKYIRFVDSFPTTTSGKVQKYIIRQRMIEELGLPFAP
jgi:fatty-acyl-CoA synthase